MAEYQAIGIPASTNWRGNDGTWSTFLIQVGSGAVPIELLPATSTGAVWIVTPDGCPYEEPYTETQCQTNRGGVYDYNQSTTFSYYGGGPVEYGLSFFAEVTLGEPYNTSGNTQAAIDIIDNFKFPSGVHLHDQFLETYTSAFPYVGLLGLTNRANNLSTTTEVYPSMLETLANQSSASRISPYWAYTAGFYNYQTPYDGSLTLGGYDAARGNTDNVLTVPLNTQLSTRDTSVNLASITITSVNGDVAQGTVNAFMYIDSVVPEIWLPRAGYTVFEQAFGITYDEDLSLYIINSTKHDELLQQNATVELALTAGSESTTISIPYLALHQPISYPLAGITDQSVMYYLPLRRASEDPSADQYILGRVFLQAAYLAVDYSREEFYISQAKFPENPNDSNLTTVYPVGVRNPTAITTTTPFPRPDTLDTAEIAGIVVGVIGAITILLVLLWWLFRRRRAEKRRQQGEAIRQMSETGPVSGGKSDLMGYYGGGHKNDEEEETYEKRELDANGPSRPSIAYEMPSPPLPQYSPGSRSPGSPGSHQSQHLRNISADSAELPADYLTARRLPPLGGRGPGGPWELQGDNEHPGSVSPPMEMGIGTVRGSGERARPVSPIELGTRTLNPSTNF